MSVPNLQQNSQATTNFYLAHIYQQTNGSQPPIPSSLSNPIEEFTPPSSAVWVNGLWFLSFVISLTCALLSTLLLRCARRYQRVAYPNFGPQPKARIRAFYNNGVEELRVTWMIECLPTLLHISLFFFFAGLSIFLFSVNRAIFKVVTVWIMLCVILYAWLTVLPIYRKDSPYSTPLSEFFSFYLDGIQYLCCRLLQWLQQMVQIDLSKFMHRGPGVVHLVDLFSRSLAKTANEFALNLHPKIDHNSLLGTLQSLDEDTELEKFFERLPRLCDSEIGKRLRLQEGFIEQNQKELSSALIGLMNRTLPTNLVTEFVKQRRMIICTKVVNSTSLLGHWWILRCVLLGEWSKFLECIEFGLFVQNWKNVSDKVTSFTAQCVAALTISNLRRELTRDKIRDERWLQLAAGLLKVPNFVLHRYITHGDSILLANAIFIVRRTVQTYSGAKDRHRSDILDASSKTLGTICELDIGSTLPELQHEFCGLWNQLVYTAQTDPLPHHSFVCTMMLKNIRKLYLASHENSGTHSTFYSTTDDSDLVLNDPKSYLLCTNDGHRPSMPILDLQFDEPIPDAPGGVTPNMMPLPSPTTTPHHSSSSTAPRPTPSVPSPYYGGYGPYGYSPSSVYLPSHSAAPFLDPTVPFLEPHLTRSDASNSPPGGNAQS